MDYKNVVESVFTHLENDEIEKAAMACLRISRHLGDHLNSALFQREISMDNEALSILIHNDTGDLVDEAKDYIWKRSLERWSKIHTTNFVSTLNKDANIINHPIGAIDLEIQQCDAMANDVDDLELKVGMRLRVSALQIVKTRVRNLCHNFATGVDRQFQSQSSAQSFLWSIQNDVNNYFRNNDPSTFDKLTKACELASSSKSEDSALVLAAVRRALKSSADHFYPPIKGKTKCSDGVERDLNDEKYMNRLSEYISTRLTSSTARDLAKAEVEVVDKFVHKINSLASKGVHAEVSREEARQGLLSLFMLLSTITQRAPLSA